MFDGYTASELVSILAMQGFAGLILFSVFLLMAASSRVIPNRLTYLMGTRPERVALLAFAVLILVAFPLAMDSFRLNIFGKYMTYAFVAVGLVLCWGMSGILSLGQGVFFGLGGHCMAMFLKLEAPDPVSTSIQSTLGIPDFMDWNQLTALSWFWQPFHSLTFTIVAVVVVPTVFAFVLGTALFIGVVSVFPLELAGLYEQHVRPRLKQLSCFKKPLAALSPTPGA